MNDNLKEKSRNLVMKHEGFKPHVYKCSKGFLTVGYGFNLENGWLPKSVADLWLNIKLENIESELSRRIDFWSKLNEARQAVLIDMAYNIGVEGIFKFKKMLCYLDLNDYEMASKEMVNSDWFREVPNRVSELQKIMLTGEL